VSREAKILIAILVVVVGGLIGLFLLVNKPTPTPAGDKTKITRSTTHHEGSGSIQMVEFGDYQCPACGAAYPNVKQIMKDFDGKVTLSFRNFPLTQLHPNAQLSAQAAEAAALQNKFWEMHDKLYETQKDWSDLSDPTDTFVGYAKDLGLNTDKFKTDLTSDAVKNTIAQDLADATALNLNGTPTFFFNGTQYTGNSDYASLRDQIQSLLGAAASTTPTPSPSASASPAQ